MEEQYTIDDIIKDLRYALYKAQLCDGYDNQIVQIVGMALEDVKDLKNAR